MFKLVVVVKVKPEKAAAFEEAVKPLVENSRKEKGCISYELLPDLLNSDDCYLFLECWESDKALEEHTKTCHYRTFISSINEYTVAPPTMYRVEPENI